MENGKTRICGRVAKPLKLQVQAIAHQERRSVSSLVELFLREGVKHLEGQLSKKEEET